MSIAGQVCPNCAMAACECDDRRWDDNDDQLSDEEMAEEECGRWVNGNLSQHCTKAGSEECDWICPLSGDLRYRKARRK